MSESAGCVWIFIIIALLIVVFTGEPDLHGALIMWLQK